MGAGLDHQSAAACWDTGNLVLCCQEVRAPEDRGRCAFRRYLHKSKLHALDDVGWVGLPSFYSVLDPAVFCIQEIERDLEHGFHWHECMHLWQDFIVALPGIEASQMAFVHALHKGMGRSVAALLVFSCMHNQSWVHVPGRAEGVLTAVFLLLSGQVNSLAHNAAHFVLDLLEPGAVVHALCNRPEWQAKLPGLIELLCVCCMSFIHQPWNSAAPMRTLVALIRHFGSEHMPQDSAFRGALLGACQKALQQQQQEALFRQRVWAAILYITLHPDAVEKGWAGDIAHELDSYQTVIVAGATEYLKHSAHEGLILQLDKDACMDAEANARKSKC